MLNSTAPIAVSPMSVCSSAALVITATGSNDTARGRRLRAAATNTIAAAPLPRRARRPAAARQPLSR